MRTKLIGGVLGLVVMFPSVCVGADFWKDPMREKEMIFKWAQNTHPGFETFEKVFGGRQVLVVVGDFGSGIIRKVVYVFLKEGVGDWHLVCFRLTNSDKITMKYDEKLSNLEFIGNAGKKLMSIPQESLTLAFPKKE